MKPVLSYIETILSLLIESSKLGLLMLSIFTSAMFFQSTSNDWLKPGMTTGLVNMHIDRSIANLAKNSSGRRNHKQLSNAPPSTLEVLFSVFIVERCQLSPKNITE